MRLGLGIDSVDLSTEYRMVESYRTLLLWKGLIHGPDCGIALALIGYITESATGRASHGSLIYVFDSNKHARAPLHTSSTIPLLGSKFLVRSASVYDA